MPGTGGLLGTAGLLGVAALVILLLAFALKKRAGRLTKPLRGLLFTALGFALCGVALAAVAGVIATGADLGWF